MIKLTTKQIAEILQADLIGDGNIEVESVSTDTRQQTSKGLFFALKGERFDGHNYAIQAVEQGCLALVVERQLDLAVPQIIVPDVRIALGQLAAWLRNEINPKIVAITGSSGKTTVKEMTASILQTAVNSEQVLFTHGNFNNDIGVPLTLLRLEPKHKFAVIELGANHRGEIAYTTKLVRPDVAIINNVAAAHLEGFGSIEGVAQAKGEIYQGLNEKGVAIIESEHRELYWKYWDKQIADSAIKIFSRQDNLSDYYAKDILLTETGSEFELCSVAEGKIAINLPYLGLHNVSNAVAAASLALNLGVNLAQIKAGLEKKSQVKGRLFPIQINENLLLLDDTYNANVNSLKSAIDVLQQYNAFRILAVGDMAELGENSKLCHQQVAEHAKQAELDLVVSFGVQSAVISQAVLGAHFTDKTEMADFLIKKIVEQLEQKQKIVLLAKGSRSQKMEEIISMIQQYFKGNASC